MSVVIFLVCDAGAGMFYAGVTRRKKEAVLADVLRVRIENPYFHHGLASNQSATFQWGLATYSFFTNSLGFRDREIREIAKKKTQGKRVLILGDSFAEGVGWDFDETFAGILQQRLSGDNIEILNSAVSSYSPTIYYYKTKYLLETLGIRFDEVILFLDISDIQDEAERYSVQDGVIHRVDGNNLEHLSENKEMVHIQKMLNEASDYSLTANVLNLSLSKLTAVKRSTELTRSAWTYDQTLFDRYGRDGLIKADQYLTQLADLLRARKIKLTLCIYPWPDQIFFPQGNPRMINYWETWARKEQVELINLFPIFLDRGDAVSVIRHYFIAGDCHWNSSGHRLVADSLMELHDFELAIVPQISRSS